MMMRRALATILLAACATETPEQGDGRDDAIAADGKGDGTLSITPAELSRMFVVASLYPKEYLKDEVGLSSLAAQSIANKAQGPDGHRGSIDDTYFSTLAQLDAVPWVGPIALGKLLAHAQADDLVIGTSQDWRVRSQTAYATQTGLGLWGSEPAFTIDRDGALVALYQTGIHEITLAIDGDTAVVPAVAGTTAYNKLHVAVDDTNAVHVFFEVYGSPQSGFKHFTFRDGQWSDLGLVKGSSLRLATNPAGAIWGLARGEKFEGAGFVSFAELHHFASDPAQSTVETLPATLPIFGTDPMGIGVGSDGVPVLAWLHGTCKTHGCGVESVQLARRTTSGFSSVQMPGNPTLSRTSAVLTAGGPDATIVVAHYSSAPVVLHETAGALVAGTAVDTQALATGVGIQSSIAIDSQGALHGCGHPQSTSSLTHLEIDAAGNGVGTPILNGQESRFCKVVSDSAGHVNLVYGHNGVYIRATHN